MGYHVIDARIDKLQKAIRRFALVLLLSNYSTYHEGTASLTKVYNGEVETIVVMQEELR